MKDDMITKVEREVVREHKHRDGIPQIIAGIFIAISMLFIISGKSSMFVIYIPFIPIGIEAMRKRFTYPRIGYAQIKENSPTRLFGIWLVLAVLIVGLVAFLLLRKSIPVPQIQERHRLLLMSGIAIVVVAFSILFLMRDKSSRILWYACLILAFMGAILLFKLNRHTVQWVVFAFGIAHIFWGIFNLITFTRKYPVLKDE